jgi:hypothetical protein
VRAAARTQDWRADSLSDVCGHRAAERLRLPEVRSSHPDPVHRAVDAALPAEFVRFAGRRSVGVQPNKRAFSNRDVRVVNASGEFDPLEVLQ